MTEDKTTITDNETIARFMGYVYQIEEWCGSNILKDDLFSETGKSMQPFNPDESWSDLMPVWYKFKDLDSYSLELSEWSIYRYYWNTIANDIPRKPIADVCKLLAEGIRWYNSTQNKEQS